MKVIPKMLLGNFIKYFTEYRPVLAPQEAQLSLSTDKASSSKEGNELLTEKDLLKMLQTVDGLPNEMDSLVSTFSSIFGTSGISSSISTEYLSNYYLRGIAAVKRATFNKKEYDKAYTEVEKNGGLNEIAITTNGGVLVLDSEGNLKAVSPQEYRSGEYTPVTNSNLLHLRAYDPQQVGNNGIFGVTNNGLGMNAVAKMILDRISNLGTATLSQEYYLIKNLNMIMLGLAVLNDADFKETSTRNGMTLDGLYKLKRITKDLMTAAKAALNYIYSTLPENAKTLLLIKSPDKNNLREGALGIIANLINSKMDTTIEYGTNYDGLIDLNGYISKTAKDSNKNPQGQYTNMISGLGGTSGWLTINTGNNSTITSYGTTYGSIPDRSGKPVPATSLRNLLSSGLLGIVTDTNGISFGDHIVSDLDKNNIVYNGGSGLVVTLPAKIVNGVKVVDLSVGERWDSFMLEIKNNNIDYKNPKNKDRVKELLHDCDLDGLIGDETGLDFNKIGLFLVTDGYLIDKNDKEEYRTSKAMTHIDLTDEVELNLENILSTSSKPYKIKSGVWVADDDVYKGAIYIPLSNNLLLAWIAEGSTVNENQAHNAEENYLQSNKELNTGEVSSDALK